MSKFTMPAEWEKHEATLLAWPHNKNDWPGKFEPIPWVYVEMIRLLTRHERVHLIVRNELEQEKVQHMLALGGVDTARVDFFIIPTNRIWMRDSGPIIVRDKKGKRVMLDWRFNAWAKYSNYKLDDKIPSLLENAYVMERVQPMHKGKRVVLEGGSIDVNGKGALITTEECLLSDIQCRNPGFTREDYENIFEEYLGVHDVIWLGDGVKNDDTHGHVDDLARFINDDTIIAIRETDKKADNYEALNDNWKRLKKTRFTIVELPMPSSVIFEALALPASYANFLIANKLVLVPVFNDPNDRLALNIIAECFPKHEVVGVPSRDFIWGFGTVHCASQQIPA